jgi:hypothetical protein
LPGLETDGEEDVEDGEEAAQARTESSVVMGASVAKPRALAKPIPALVR